MALKPDSNVMIAAVTAAAVFAVFQLEAPPLADVRASAPGGLSAGTTHRSVKGAVYTSTAVVLGLALLAKSPEIYVVGGLVTAGLGWKYYSANVTHPVTGAVVAPGVNAGAVAGGGTIQGS
jgi:hypothetical protein